MAEIRILNERLVSFIWGRTFGTRTRPIFPISGETRSPSLISPTISIGGPRKARLASEFHYAYYGYIERIENVYRALGAPLL